MARVKKDWNREEHMFGWCLYKGSRMIAELEYRQIDDPCYVFRVVTAHESELDRLAQLRGPEPDVRYENRVLDISVPDVDFCLSNYDSGLVSIRDLRLPPMVPSIYERVRALVAGIWRGGKLREGRGQSGGAEET
jgi:hypothetical protein